MMSAPSRGWLVTAYLLLAAAGAAALVWTSPSVSAAGGVWALTWAVFLAAGGALAALAAFRRHWLGEYIGLPLLITVWAVYGLAAGASVLAGRLNSLPACLGLLGVAALLAARWQAVETTRAAARRSADNRPGDHGEG